MFLDGAPMERDAPFQNLLLHISLPEEPQSPILSQTVCKPDKPLDIRRSLWAAPIKGNAPFSEPLINSFIHISWSPHLSHTGKRIQSPSTEPQWGAAWFPKGIVDNIAIDYPSATA
jgi:hypothetical protein